MEMWRLLPGWLLPAYWVAGGLLAGILVDRVLGNRLRAIAARTRWPLDDVVFAGLRGVLVLWPFLLGCYFAVEAMALPARTEFIVERLLLILFILSATIVAARITGNLVNYYSGKSAGLLPSTSIFRNLAKAVVFALGLLVVLQTLGVQITPVLTALGVGGLAVALALQDTLSNLFAGLHIIASGQVRPGDFIRLESGEEGYVEDIRWRNTTVRSLPNNMVIVPNSKLASAVITNYNLPSRHFGFGVAMTVDYDADLELVEKICLEVAQQVVAEVEGGVADPPPSVAFHTFGEVGIQLSVNMRAAEFVMHYRMKHEFIKRIHARFAQAGIRIPAAVRRVELDRR